MCDIQLLEDGDDDGDDDDDDDDDGGDWVDFQAGGTAHKPI